MLDYFRSKSIILEIILSSLAKPSWKNLVAFIAISVCFSVFLHNWSALLSEKAKLNTYVKNISHRVTQSTFQMKTGIFLANQIAAPICSHEDINELRTILSNYHYISDLGRITEDNQILCSAMWGKLLEPKSLPEKSIRSSSFEKSWPFISGLFSSNQIREIFSTGNAFVVASPATYLDIVRYSSKTGSVLYTKETKQIYRIFDDITIQQAQNLIHSPTPKLPLLTTPNSVLTVTNCPKSYDFCVSAIDSKIGIYDMGLWDWIKMLFIGSAIGIILSFLVTFYIANRRTLIYRLKYAIKMNAIYSLYQPKIHLKTGKIVGVEALARWDDNELGKVSPDLFINAAESHNIITELTKNLIIKNLKQIAPFLKNDTLFSLSINLTVKDLSDQDFLTFIDNEVKRNGINSEQIIFEVTERSAAQNNVLKNATKNFLRKGYKISLDDFGTGFSNLSWLTTFEPNEIKIDKMFVQSIGTQTVSQIALNGIFQLVGSLNVNLVFEGIESVKEVNYILQFSPDAIGQGWLYSKAVDIATLDELIKSQPYMQSSFLKDKR
ncbi:EAL domain-containing protein [Marinomonas shanghaiensis]|uniref:EAL domain-containing protein n=1 Tax=Marinomonas shanghaiensis TaxID=2202418 RepID=UPI000DBA3A40|nr:EAL domain-containing protein [Marinomonas shanghaiensis]